MKPILLLSNLMSQLALVLKCDSLKGDSNGFYRLDIDNQSINIFINKKCIIIESVLLYDINDKNNNVSLDDYIEKVLQINLLRTNSGDISLSLSNDNNLSVFYLMPSYISFDFFYSALNSLCYFVDKCESIKPLCNSNNKNNYLL